MGPAQTGDLPASEAAAPECSCCRGVRTTRSSGWLIRESENFRILTPARLAAPRHFPGHCESLRRELESRWNAAAAAWTPRCDIVLHPGVAEYSRELGPGSEQSSGCATIELDGERVVRRRIDVRLDAADWLTDALPHELTHVVLADLFAGRQIPRWADEGMAVLAESPAKQEARRRHMAAALDRAETFSPGELFRLRDYPAAARRDAFYGQSARLVAHLAGRDTPARFIEFVRRAVESDHETALREIYGLPSSAALRIDWKTPGRAEPQTRRIAGRPEGRSPSGARRGEHSSPP